MILGGSEWHGTGLESWAGVLRDLPSDLTDDYYWDLPGDLTKLLNDLRRWKFQFYRRIASLSVRKLFGKLDLMILYKIANSK